MQNLIAVSLISVLAATGCVTTGGNQKVEKSGQKTTLPTDSLVVQKAGKSEPVVSNLDRGAWVAAHASGTDDQKMFAAMAAGEFKSAISEAQEYIKTHPKHRGSLVVLASSYALTKDFERARLYARLLQRYHPGQPESMNIEGLALMLQPQVSMMDLKAAANLFEQAFSMNGSEVAAGLNLGQLYLEIGDSDKAAEVLATVKGRCGGCAEARFSLGTALARIGKFDQAGSEFQQILDENPRDAEAMYRLALVAKNGYNDLNKAKGYLRRILALDSRTTGQVYRQAHVMLRRLEGIDARKVGGGNTAIAKDRAPIDGADDIKDDGELLPANTTK